MKQKRCNLVCTTSSLSLGLPNRFCISSTHCYRMYIMACIIHLLSMGNCIMLSKSLTRYSIVTLTGWGIGNTCETCQPLCCHTIWFYELFRCYRLMFSLNCNRCQSHSALFSSMLLHLLNIPKNSYTLPRCFLWCARTIVITSQYNLIYMNLIHFNWLFKSY